MATTTIKPSDKFKEDFNVSKRLKFSLAVAVSIMTLQVVPVFAASYNIDEIVAAAQMKIAKGSPREAVSMLSFAAKLEPDNLTIKRKLGQALIRCGLAVKAKTQLEEICRSSQSQAEDFSDLGDACRYSGKMREALSAYQESLRRAPENTSAVLGMIHTYLGCGDLKTAKLVAKSGIKRVSDLKGRTLILAELKRITETEKASVNNGVVKDSAA